MEIDDYIQKYCVKHEIDEETAKTHAIVKEVAKAYGVDLKESEGSDER